MLVQVLLTGCAPSKPPCGEGWDRERYLDEMSEDICSIIEACHAANYGPVYIGPDHDGCVLHARQDLGDALDDSESRGCGTFEGCEAQRNAEAMEDMISSCDGSIWWAYDYCAMP